MKKIYAMMLALCLLSVSAFAQQTVTIDNPTVGGLSANLSAKFTTQLAPAYNTVTTLKITGVMGKSDFTALSQQLGKCIVLNTLDLTGLTHCYKTKSVYDASSQKYVEQIVGDGYLPQNAFANSLFGNAALNSILLPENVITTIGYGAFGGAVLSSLTIPASVKTIESNAFGGIYKLQKLDIPVTVDSVGDRLFSYAKSIKEVNFLNPNLKMGNNGYMCFSGANALQKVSLPARLDTIGYQMFIGCGELTTLDMDFASVKVIASQAFSGCAKLATLDLSSVETIGQGAFLGCTSLQLDKQSFPRLKTLSGDSPFAGCNGLTSIDLTNVKITGIDYDGNEIPSQAGIMSNTFNNCTNLTDVTLPSTITTLSGFGGTTKLTQLTIPASVTTIGAGAFSGSGITSATVPQNVTTIGSSAFRNCAGLTSISLPAGLATIGANAFQNCTGLTGFTVPASVSDIGDYAWAGCTGLTSITSLATDPVQPDGNHTFDNVTKTIPLYLTQAAIDQGDYAYCPGWKDFNNRQLLQISGIWDTKNNASFALLTNPVQNEARFTFAAAAMGAKIIIIDLNGKTVANRDIASGATEAVIDVDNLTKGIYIAKYSDAQGRKGTLKLMK